MSKIRIGTKFECDNITYTILQSCKELPEHIKKENPSEGPFFGLNSENGYGWYTEDEINNFILNCKN